MKKILLLFTLFTFTFIYAQPSISWQKSFGGTTEDKGYAIEQTSDGGYITTGTTLSPIGGNFIHSGNYDYYVVKMDSNGVLEWQKSFGGTADDIAYSIKQTTDGGYIMAGETLSNNGDVSGNHGGSDFWIVKLDSTGTMEWQKCLGSSGHDVAYTIDKTNDGNYIIAGYSRFNDGDVTGIKGYENAYELGPNFWIVKISQKGTIIWEKSYGGYSDEIANSIHQTTDGGYIVSGSSHSGGSLHPNNLDVIGNHGGYDYWVLKLDDLGNLQWQKCLGGSKHDFGGSSLQTSDGGYLVSGCSISNDGDVSGNHGNYDYWVVKLNSTGGIQWQKSFGGSNLEIGNQYSLNSSVQQTDDRGYILAGWSMSNDGDVSGNHGSYDYWLVKFLEGGDIEWQKCLGGSNTDNPSSIKPTSDGGYIISGYAKSNNGDVSENHGNADFWIVKLGNALGLNDLVTGNSFIIYPNPAKNQINISWQNSAENLDSVVIYNVLGNCVKKANNLSANQAVIDVSDLSKGVYLIDTTTESQLKLTKKLVIE